MTMLPANLSAPKVIIGKKQEWSEDMIEDYMMADSLEKIKLKEIWGEPPFENLDAGGLDLMGVM